MRADAEHRQRREPDQHDRTEDRADSRRAALWMRNRPTRMTIVIGTTYGVKTGVATSSPSTALSTEIAGVIMPSP